MLVQSDGIVLKTTKYGETSLICQIFTRIYGLKSFIIKGVRSFKKQNSKANVFQVGNLLRLTYYHTPHKSLQLVKEAQLCYTYQTLRENIPSSCVQLFCIEVLQNVLQSDYPQEDIYDFTKDIFCTLDTTNGNNTLLPSFFLITINKLSGYTIQNNYSDNKKYFNIWDGKFQDTMSNLPPFINEEASRIIAQLSDIYDTKDLLHIHHCQKQHEILRGLLVFMEHHYPSFKTLKSLSVMNTILS